MNGLFGDRAVHAALPFARDSNALRARPVEQNRSNLVALIRPSGSRNSRPSAEGTEVTTSSGFAGCFGPRLTDSTHGEMKAFELMTIRLRDAF